VNLFKRFRDAGLAILLLALPFFFLRANLRDPSKASFLDRWLLEVSAPMQWVAVRTARGVSSFVEEYVYLVEVKKDNDRLGYENARLREQARELEQLERENERLRALLLLRDELSGEKISARVIGKNISSLFRVIRVRLDRGRDDRVVNGMPVVTPEGLVGQISRVSDRYADVMLTVDESSAVDVVVERTGARGILRGTGESDSYKCRIQYLLRADEVRVGDAVYTSGLGLRFPPHIKVGTISSVEKRDFDLHQLVEVTPAVSFSRLEEVLVLSQGARDAQGAKTQVTGARAEAP